MSGNVEAQLSGLKAFRSKLESFRTSAGGRCKTMRQGISSCAACMMDKSQVLISRADDIVADLQQAIDGPTERVLEKVLDLIGYLENEYDFGMSR